MANVLDVVQTIQNIVAQKGYDGALDSDGKPVEIGLRREVDNVVTDSRLVDGFKVRFQGNKMILSYSSECSIKSVADPKFESKVGQNTITNRSASPEVGKKTTPDYVIGQDEQYWEDNKFLYQY